MNIRSETLKQFRKINAFSQVDLANVSGIGVSTIKRIEAAKGEHVCQPRVAKKIAEVFKVQPEALAQPFNDKTDREARVRNLGYRPLGQFIDGETSLAFEMVERRYGIPVKAQMLMAPLFAAILAENSLKWRREKLAELTEAADRLFAIGGRTEHLRFAYLANRTHEPGAAEQQSIDNHDLFGNEVSDKVYDFGYNPETHNPFADYLRQAVLLLETDAIEVDPEGLQFESEKSMPIYEICRKDLENITDHDQVAIYALKSGFAKLRDIPKDLLAEDRTSDRVEWLASKLPPDVRAREEKFWAEMEELDPEVTEALVKLVKDGGE